MRIRHKEDHHTNQLENLELVKYYKVRLERRKWGWDKLLSCEDFTPSKRNTGKSPKETIIEVEPRESYYMGKVRAHTGARHVIV